MSARAVVPRCYAMVTRSAASRGIPYTVALQIPIVEGDAVSGDGLEQALDGIDVAYYLIHSMEPAATNGPFCDGRAARGASGSRTLPVEAGVRRIVYLGGILPGRRAAVGPPRKPGAGRADPARARPGLGRAARVDRDRSPLAVVSLPGPARRTPAGTRAPGLARQPHAADRRTGCDRVPRPRGDRRSGRRALTRCRWPDVVTYGQLIDRIRELMLVARPTFSFRSLTVTPIASRIAAVIAGEQHELIGPLMESLNTDLLLRRRRRGQPAGRQAAPTRCGDRYTRCGLGGERAINGPLAFTPARAPVSVPPSDGHR